MAKSRRKGDDGGGGAPAWMVTYGDLMSLLLTFFVLLLSFSTITEEEAFKEALRSFRGAVGFLPRQLAMSQVNPLPRSNDDPKRAVDNVARRIRRRLQVLGKDADINIEYDGPGDLKLSLPSQVLFDSARAELKPDSFPILNSLGEILSELPEAFFEVRGHTDNRPLLSSTQFRDNHDLSVARADSVARFISRAAVITLDQFEIVGAGAGQPMSPNLTVEGQQANRRVEIYVRGLLGTSQASDLRRRIELLTNPPDGVQN